ERRQPPVSGSRKNDTSAPASAASTSPYMDARRRRARASSALRDVEDQPARDEERERDRDHDGDATEVLQHERTLERGRPFERGRRRADRARGPGPRPVPQPRRRRERRIALDDLRAWYRRAPASLHRAARTRAHAVLLCHGRTRIADRYAPPPCSR